MPVSAADDPPLIEDQNDVAQERTHTDGGWRRSHDARHTSRGAWERRQVIKTYGYAIGAYDCFATSGGTGTPRVCTSTSVVPVGTEVWTPSAQDIPLTAPGGENHIHILPPV